MGRPRLTEAERLARKKERNRRGFTEATFRQYDPTDGLGRGSAEQWRAAAHAATGSGFTMDEIPPPPTSKNADLAMLELFEMPTWAGLRAAYRKLAPVKHPNGGRGGTHASFLAFKEAYDRLEARLKRG